MLKGKQRQSHGTARCFCQNHQQCLAGLIDAVLRLCAEAGSVLVGLLTPDRPKLRTTSSRQRNRKLVRGVAGSGFVNIARKVIHGIAEEVFH